MKIARGLTGGASWPNHLPFTQCSSPELLAYPLAGQASDETKVLQRSARGEGPIDAHKGEGAVTAPTFPHEGIGVQVFEVAVLRGATAIGSCSDECLLSRKARGWIAECTDLQRCLVDSVTVGGLP